MVQKGLALLFAGLLMVGVVGCPEETEEPVVEEQWIDEIPEEPVSPDELPPVEEPMMPEGGN